MPEIANLQVVVGADTSAAERGLDSLGQKVGGVGSAIQSALGAAAVGAVAGLGAAFVGSVKSAADFEKQMSAVGAVAGASQAEMEQLTKAALQLGKDTSFSATEAAQGLEELVKAGVSVEDILGGGAKAALDLAAAGAVSVADAAEIASNAMNVFGLAGSDMAHVADLIAGAANASAISVTDYKFSLSAAGAVAATVGISFESLTEAIAIMGNAGIKGSDAGTSLKTMMMNLVPATDKAANLMQELGIITEDGSNQFFDATGKAKSFAEISEVLKNALHGMSEEQKIATLRTLFGSDAIRAAAVMAEAGAEGFEQMAEAMGKVSAAQVAEERLNNLWGSIEKLQGSLETAAIMLGGLFTPALKAMADATTEYVNQAIEVIEELPDAWRTFVQAFEGGWEPSDTLSPFINLVGKVGLAIRQLYTIAAPYIRQLGEIWQKVMAQDITGALDQFLALVQSVAARLAPILAQWAQQFIAWIGPMIPPFLAALGNVISQLLSWIAAQVPVLAAALLAWATEWVQWLIDAAPLLIDAAWAFIEPLLAWMAEQIPVLAAQLLEWGQQFVDWVAPMIPPLLEQLGVLAKQLLDWIIDQIPGILAQMLEWGRQFIEWVAPQIPPLIEELGRLSLALADWVIDQIPTITAKLVEWGLLFGAWVLAVAIPELIKALPGILLTLAEWTANVVTEIPKLMLKLGVALADGIWQGFQNAWSTIGEKIKKAISDTFTLPSFNFGGMTQTSYQGSPDSESKLMRAYQIALSKGFTEDQANAMLGTLRVEGGLMGAVGDSGNSFGPFQLYSGGQLPNFERWLQANGISGDPRALANDIELATSFALDNYYGQALRAGSAQGLSGPALATYAQRHGQVSVNPEKAGGAYGPPAGGRTPLNQMQRIPLGGDPSHWPMLIQDVIDVAPDWQTAMAQISEHGQMAFLDIKEAGTTAGADLVTTSTDDLGNVTTIYSRAGVTIGATLTDAAGNIINTWGEIAVSGAEAGRTLVSTSTDAMGNVTSIYTDAAGQMTAVITDASGQVINTFGGAAAEVTAAAEEMRGQTLSSVTQLGDGLLTTMQTSAGSTIATVTDMSGNVTSQYATLANGVQITMGDMAEGVLTSQTDLGDGIMTIVQDAAGNYIATITDLAGNVVNQYVTMADGSSEAVTGLAQESRQQFGNVSEAARSTREPIGSVSEALGDIKPPDTGGVVSAFRSIRSAASDATKEVRELLDSIKDITKASKGGGKAPWAAKAAGGPVSMGSTYLVGEAGPELFVPNASGYIVPNHMLGRGGGDEVHVNVNVYGNALASRRDIADAVVAGLLEAQRTNRTRMKVV